MYSEVYVVHEKVSGIFYVSLFLRASIFCYVRESIKVVKNANV